MQFMILLKHTKRSFKGLFDKQNYDLFRALKSFFSLHSDALKTDDEFFEILEADKNTYKLCFACLMWF